MKKTLSCPNFSYITPQPIKRSVSTQALPIYIPHIQNVQNDIMDHIVYQAYFKTSFVNLKSCEADLQIPVDEIFTDSGSTDAKKALISCVMTPIEFEDGYQYPRLADTPRDQNKVIEWMLRLRKRRSKAF